jgi:hypothetical protein
VLDSSAEQAQPGHDLRHGVVVDDVPFELRALLAAQLTAPVEAGVPGPQQQPARFGQRGGSRVLVVGHEQVELFHIAGQTLHRRRCQPLAGAASTGDFPGTEVTEEVQHEGAHPGGVSGQAGPISLPAVKERVELVDRDDPAVHRRPAQHCGVQADLGVPLQAASQPRRADPVEPHRVPAHRFVIAQGDPSVLGGVPLVQLPPGAGVGGGDQQAHHARQQRADVSHRGGARQPSGAPRGRSPGTSPGPRAPAGSPAPGRRDRR